MVTVRAGSRNMADAPLVYSASFAHAQTQFLIGEISSIALPTPSGLHRGGTDPTLA
jgi:hypothetical protein